MNRHEHPYPLPVAVSRILLAITALDFFKDRIKKIEDDGHDTSDWKTACEKAMEWGDTIYIGLFLQKDQPTLSQLEPVLDEGGPLAYRPLGLSQEQSQRILKRMM